MPIDAAADRHQSQARTSLSTVGMLVRLPFSVTTTACERIRSSPRILGN
jgi:hypothetical protein